MCQALNSDKTQFEKLTISLTEYKKGKINSGEYSAGAKLYDVKSISIKGDQVELLVINDTDEEDIVKHIKDFITGGNHPKKDRPYQLRQFLTLKFLAPEDFQNMLIPINSCLVYNLVISEPVTIHREIQTPPPESV